MDALAWGPPVIVAVMGLAGVLATNRSKARLERARIKLDEAQLDLTEAKAEFDRMSAIQSSAERYREQLLADHREMRKMAEDRAAHLEKLLMLSEARNEELVVENERLKDDNVNLQRIVAEVRPTRRTK